MTPNKTNERFAQHTTMNQIRTHSTGRENAGPPSIYALSLRVADNGNERTELAKQISDKITGNKGDGDGCCGRRGSFTATRGRKTTDDQVGTVASRTTTMGGAQKVRLAGDHVRNERTERSVCPEPSSDIVRPCRDAEPQYHQKVNNVLELYLFCRKRSIETQTAVTCDCIDSRFR